MTFIYSPRHEAERVINTLSVVMSGFYERHGFVVLPEIAKDIEESIVVLPRQNYSGILGLFDVLKGRVSAIPLNINAEWLDKMEKLIGNNDPLPVKSLETEWSNVEDRFWIEVEKFFPGSAKMIGEIEVRVTRYGTTSTGSWMKGEIGQKMYFYLREDRGIEDVAAMMINQILHSQREELGITWSKREALMDFIMTRPAMKKLFPKFRPVMSSLLRVPAFIRKESESYLSFLKIPKIKKDFELVQGKIAVRGVGISRELSKLEKKVLKLLIQNVGEVVTYDQIADDVWGVGEFKTFWAINKLVERLRSKFSTLDIDVKRLKSVRGQGYLLE